MEIRSRRDSAAGIVGHLRHSYGRAWDRMTREQKAHEFRSHQHLLAAIGKPSYARNPFEENHND